MGCDRCGQNEIVRVVKIDHLRSWNLLEEARTRPNVISIKLRAIEFGKLFRDFLGIHNFLLPSPLQSSP